MSIEKLVIKDIKDEKYRMLLNKEYQFCMDNAERIQKKANKIYEMVTTNRKLTAARDVADPWYTGDFDATFDDVISGCRDRKSVV